MTQHRILPRPFGHFRVARQLGRGGMAAVYDAEDVRLGCRVALKVCHFGPEAPDAVERFRREARFARRVHHPFVCPVYEDGEIGGFHYLTMPLVEGTSLDRRSGPAAAWQPGAAAELVRRLALALQAVHAAGVVHRDLKPHNVMLRPTGEPLLVDFGLARDLTGEERGLTTPGTALGTIQFTSPEQLRGRPATVGPPADVYSLGVILYQLLCGALPFDGVGVADLYRRILHDPPPRPSDLRPGIDPRLDEICLRALAKSPEARYATMTAFADALAGFQGQASSGSTPPPETTESIRTPVGGMLEVAVPGVWSARPAGRPEASWERAGATPGVVPYAPGMVYQLSVDAGATDTDLASLAGLSGLSSLHALDLGRCEVATPDGLTPVGELRHLRSLRLTRSGVGGGPLTDGAADLLAAGLGDLEEFRGRLPDLSDGGLGQFCGLAGLVRADLYDCGRLTDAGLGHLVRLTRLEHLTLGACEMTDLGLRRVAAVRTLVALSIEDCRRVTGAGLAHLRGLDRLRSFTLAGGSSRVGDYALTHLAALPALERLEIRDCPHATGAGFALLAGARGLRHLALASCLRLTDDALAALGRAGLRSLALTSCPRVTPAGLASLHGAELESLTIVGCERIGPDAVERFRQASPGCEVTFRRA